MAYSNEFYRDRHKSTVYSARQILAIVLESIPSVHSAVDVGCGVGTWLSALRERGINKIQGIDGPWVDHEQLVIPSDSFAAVDLNIPLPVSTSFDLAISLEVAEHLPEQCADQFVASLTSLSDFVLFSAAIPLQGGYNHVNEQWPGYWVERFAALDYVAFDFVRPVVWNDREIPYWYRQNVLFFSKRERQSDVKHEPTIPLRLVHPELYLAKFGRSGEA